MVHSHHTWLKFVRNYLDLANRLEEAIAALIMVLGFTLIAGITAVSAKQGVRTLLLGALGCNTAWGIIDGVLFAWGNLTDRRLQLRFLTNLRSAPNESEVLSAIGGRLNPLLEPEVGAEERTRLCEAMLPVVMRVKLPNPDLTKDDVDGMIAIFMIDVVAVIPAVIPFLFFTEPRIALRISNGTLIVLLFITGLMWGRRTGFNGYFAGFCAMLLGLALVGVAIALACFIHEHCRAGLLGRDCGDGVDGSVKRPVRCVVRITGLSELAALRFSAQCFPELPSA